MLKTYEAIIQDGQVQWLADQPDFKSARILITVVEDLTPESTSQRLSQAHIATKALSELTGSEQDAKNIPRRRFPPTSIAGKGRTLGDIVSPIAD